VAGLAGYLRAERIDALVDATHPYADTMAAHAAEAAAQTSVPLLALKRKAWTAGPGDRWIEVRDAEGATTALGTRPRRVFLAIGRNDVGAFEAAPQHNYLIRSVDPVVPPLKLPHASYVVARGPFDEAVERALLKDHRIEYVVAKNSGGDATYGKIAAARALGVSVVMLQRPALPDVPTVGGVDEALAWLDHAPAPSAERGV
jgi:precorrin-6A/cobalt-precorrin-6A reductase